MASLTWRTFTREDWFGYAGAASFSDGREPLVAELKVDGAHAVAVLDAEGLSILWGGTEDEDGEAWWFGGVEAARLIALMGPEMTRSNFIHGEAV